MKLDSNLSARDRLLKDCLWNFSKDNLSKDSFSKDGPAQIGPIIEILDEIPESTLNSMQVVAHPRKQNLYKCHDLGPEPTVWAETWSTSIRIDVNKPTMAFPRSGDRPRDRKVGFRGPGLEN